MCMTASASMNSTARPLRTRPAHSLPFEAGADCMVAGMTASRLRLAGSGGGKLVELADFGFAVAGNVEEALGEGDGFFFRVRPDQGEAADYLFGFGKRPIGHGEFAAAAADARSERAGQTSFGAQQYAFLSELLDQLAHTRHLVRRGRGSFGSARLIDAKKSHGGIP